MAIESETSQSPLRMLVEHLLSQHETTLQSLVDARRAAGDSWGDIAARIYATTDKTVSVPWLIKQCGPKAEARP